MEIGISSSCLYPMLLEDSLRTVGELGAKTAELFVNAPCELEKPFLKKLCDIRDFYGINIRTLHPFTSSYETVLLFSEYERRTRDGIEIYKRYFDAANETGAKAVVIHGGISLVPVSVENYAYNYSMLLEAAREQGVYVAHENVRNCHCGKPEFMKAVADIVGDDFRMVLDTKQCRRNKVSEFDYIDALGDKIIQAHISDCLEGQDCIAPGEGNYDFKKLFDALRNAGYNESAIIELYRWNFDTPEDLRKAKHYLEKQEKS